MHGSVSKPSAPVTLGMNAHLGYVESVSLRTVLSLVLTYWPVGILFSFRIFLATTYKKELLQNRQINNVHSHPWKIITANTANFLCSGLFPLLAALNVSLQVWSVDLTCSLGVRVPAHLSVPHHTGRVLLQHLLGCIYSHWKSALGSFQWGQKDDWAFFLTLFSSPAFNNHLSDSQFNLAGCGKSKPTVTAHYLGRVLWLPRGASLLSKLGFLWEY